MLFMKLTCNAGYPHHHLHALRIRLDFLQTKDKKLHADQARQNFVRAGGDHFTLLNVWEQWADTGYSQQFCYEQFLQFKSLSRARDIRDQLAGLCERVEVVIQPNPNSNDIIPIQKALTSGYFYNTVSSFSSYSERLMAH